MCLLLAIHRITGLAQSLLCASEDAARQPIPWLSLSLDIFLFFFKDPKKEHSLPFPPFCPKREWHVSIPMYSLSHSLRGEFSFRRMSWKPWSFCSPVLAPVASFVLGAWVALVWNELFWNMRQWLESTLLFPYPDAHFVTINLWHHPYSSTSSNTCCYFWVSGSVVSAYNKCKSP